MSDDKPRPIARVAIPKGTRSTPTPSYCYSFMVFPFFGRAVYKPSIQNYYPEIASSV